MIIKSFDIQRKYPIKCNAYLPSKGTVNAVVIGVHGFAGDKESSMLLQLAGALESRGCAVITFNFPAHGNSDRGEDDLTVENCMNDLLAVAKWCEYTYPAADKYIFATSFGGYISLLSSHNLKEYKIVLRAPAVTMPKVLLGSVLKMSAKQFKDMGVVRCGFERKILLPFSFYEDLIKYDPYKRAYENKMLVIHGDKDDIVSVEDVIEFCRDRKNIELVILENADHRFKKPGEIERIICETIKFMENVSNR